MQSYTNSYNEKLTQISPLPCSSTSIFFLSQSWGYEGQETITFYYENDMNALTQPSLHKDRNVPHPLLYIYIQIHPWQVTFGVERELLTRTLTGDETASRQ